MFTDYNTKHVGSLEKSRVLPLEYSDVLVDAAEKMLKYYKGKPDFFSQCSGLYAISKEAPSHLVLPFPKIFKIRYIIGSWLPQF